MLKKLATALLITTIALLPLSSCGKPVAETTEDVNTGASESRDTINNDEVVTDKIDITCLKAGAADAFVLISDDHVVVIDTGLDKNKEDLVELMKDKGVTRVDELIITHFDKDHVGGADAVIDEFEIGNVYATYQSKDSDDITHYYEALERKGLRENVVRTDFFYEADGVTYEIFAPKKTEYINKTSNNSSLVIRVSLGDYSMLFAGDAEEERIEELLDTPGLESTVLKVPHHGRNKTNFEEFIEYISPEYAIITSSKSEPEDQEVIDALEANDCQVYLTRNGTIEIEISSNGIDINQ